MSAADADTLTRAAELLETQGGIFQYWHVTAHIAIDMQNTAFHLREMAAARKRIAEPEWDIDLASIEELRFCAHVQRGSIDRLHARIAELEAERDRLKANLVALEDEKNAYIEYVGDTLGQGEDESLWDASQRVISSRDRFRVTLTALVRVAESRPFSPIGHVIEHELCEIDRLTAEALKETDHG